MSSDVANVPLPPVSFFDDTSSKRKPEDAESEGKDAASKRKPDDAESEGKDAPLVDTSAPKSKRGRKSKDQDSAEVESKNEDDGSMIDLATRPAFTVAQTHKICQENNFFMVLYNSTPFKDLVELIHPVLENITFQVVDRTTKGGQRFRGIVVNSMDAKKVSMIVARLKADDIFPDVFPDQEFCVSSENFSNLIKTIKKGCCLEIKQGKDSANIKIRGYNPNRCNRESHITVPTLDKDEEAPQLNMIDYKFLVDIDLQVLRNITRVAQNSSVNAQDINFKIFEGTDESGDYKITKVCVSLNGGPGSATLAETFRSKTKWNRQNADQTVITTSESMSDEKDADDDSRLKLVLDEKYSTKYLHLFLKSMDRQTITLRMSPARPLVIIYQLDGGENVGYCNFILAPSVKADE